MVIWTIIVDGDMITLNELVHLYRLKESKEFGYYELVPWDRRSRLIADLPSSFRYWKSRYFFVSGDGWEVLFDDFWGDFPRLLRWWETPVLGVFALHCSLFCSSFGLDYPFWPFFFLSQRSSRVRKQVCWPCSCSHWVRKHDWWFDRPKDLSSSLFGAKTFPIRPSCNSPRRKK